MTKNANPNKYKYYGYGIEFVISFLLSDGCGLGKNVIIFDADMSSLMHIDNKKKGILILDKGPTNGLDSTTLTSEKEYSINFAKQKIIFHLSLHYKGMKNYIFVNGVEIYKFKTKDLFG